MDFEGDLTGEVTPGEYLTPVHLHWDKAAEHTTAAGKRKGKWKWYAEAKHEEDEDEEGDPEPEPTPGGGDGGGSQQHKGPPNDEDSEEGKTTPTPGAEEPNKPPAGDGDDEDLSRYNGWNMNGDGTPADGTPPPAGTNADTFSGPSNEVNRGSTGLTRELTAAEQAAVIAENRPQYQAGPTPPPGQADQRTGGSPVAGKKTSTQWAAEMQAQLGVRQAQAEARAEQTTAQRTAAQAAAQTQAGQMKLTLLDRHETIDGSPGMQLNAATGRTDIFANGTNWPSLPYAQRRPPTLSTP
jgi:hypothetical protein